MTFRFLLLGLVLAAAGGCDRPRAAVRTYQELSVLPERAEAPPSAPMAPPAAGDMASTPVQTSSTKLRWTAPPGWVEQGGGQMRLVTFKVGEAGTECVITIFPGDVGGLEANLRRWLGQLQVQAADAEVSRFARAPETFQSEGGLPCLVYDFSALLPADRTDSLLAAVVPLEGSTAFVKFGGPKTLLEAEKENFRALCRSLKP